MTFIKRIIELVLILFFTYVFMVALSFALSIYHFDTALYFSITSKMSAAGCQAKATKGANPLDIINFYTNMDYWLASSRIKSTVVNHELCTKIILNTMLESKSSASVVFVDENNKVVLKIKK